MKEAVIYGLTCPKTGEVRYIGKTIKAPETRRRQHVAEAGYSRDTSHRLNWLRSLSGQGLEPGICILEKVAESDWELCEQKHIKAAHSVGARLVNGSDGGEGNKGYTPSGETKRKLSELASLRWDNEEYAERQREYHKRWWEDPENYVNSALATARSRRGRTGVGSGKGGRRKGSKWSKLERTMRAMNRSKKLDAKHSKK